MSRIRLALLLVVPAVAVIVVALRLTVPDWVAANGHLMLIGAFVVMTVALVAFDQRLFARQLAEEERDAASEADALARSGLAGKPRRFGRGKRKISGPPPPVP